MSFRYDFNNITYDYTEEVTNIFKGLYRIDRVPGEFHGLQSPCGHKELDTTELISQHILCSQRWRRSIQSAKTRPGTNSGSDLELIFPIFRLK